METMPRALNSHRLIEAIGGKTLHIPEEGWNSHNFARHGGPMLLTLQYVAKLTQRRAAPGMARDMVTIFRRQMHRVIDRVVHGRRSNAAVPGQKADVLLDIGQNEHLWAQAMDEVFSAAGLEIEVTVLPTVQSVMAQAYSKVGILLNQDADPQVNPAIARRARDIARQVTAVNDTTRKQMGRIVKESITNGMTVSETAAALEQQLPALYGNRALTIARTELNRAWTQGAVQSFQESVTQTHISVIGCESREEDRWAAPSYQPFLWDVGKGPESTCNIQDVRVGDADKLQFHPNHTGNMVPSKFRNPDGTAPLEND